MKRTKQKYSESDITIMVYDPSFTGWGYVVLNLKGEVIAADCIKTGNEAKKRRIRKGDDRVRRTTEINEILLSVISKYNVSLIITEQPHGSQNAAAAVMIGIVIGVIQTMSNCLSIPVEWISEADSKKALLGKKSATKIETVNAIKKLYSVPWSGIKYWDEAVADAMSIWHYAVRKIPTVQFLMKSKK